MEGSTSAIPIPTRFLKKTYEIVDDPSTDFVVSWSKGNNSFIVKDLHYFSLNLLPRYFKHCNISSFIRQLNTYGFRKVDPDRWEFAHESFLRGQKQLLSAIRRRRADHNQNGLAGGLQGLCEEEDAIVVEIAQLKKEQESIDKDMEDLKRRLDLTEQRPHKMISFLATVANNPNFITQMLQNVGGSNGGKKRRVSYKEKEDLMAELGFDESPDPVIPDGFIESGLCNVNLIDSEARSGLLYEDLMANCSLTDQNSGICIDKPGIDLNVAQDLGICSVDDILCWDEDISDETQFPNCNFVPEKTHIAESPESK